MVEIETQCLQISKLRDSIKSLECIVVKIEMGDEPECWLDMIDHPDA